jgi:hypothetical protein
VKIWQQNQLRDERPILKERKQGFAPVAVKKSKNPASIKCATIAGNISGIITGKFLKAYRKPAENVTSKGKQKIAAPAAEYFWEKNLKIQFAHLV